MTSGIDLRSLGRVWSPVRSKEGWESLPAPSASRIGNHSRGLGRMLGHFTGFPRVTFLDWSSTPEKVTNIWLTQFSPVQKLGGPPLSRNSMCSRPGGCLYGSVLPLQCSQPCGNVAGASPSQGPRVWVLTASPASSPSLGPRSAGWAGEWHSSFGLHCPLTPGGACRKTSLHAQRPCGVGGVCAGPCFLLPPASQTHTCLSHFCAVRWPVTLGLAVPLATQSSPSVVFKWTFNACQGRIGFSSPPPFLL